MPIWKDTAFIQRFLTETPYPADADQLSTMLHLLRHNPRPVEPKPIETFIDLGGGDGILTQLLLDEYPGAVGIMTDFSPPMLDAARTRLAPYGERERLVEADLSSPDWQQAVFPDGIGAVDAIVSRYCIHHLTHERKRALYAEIFSRLRSGGIFINIEHVASDSAWGEALQNEMYIEHLIAHELESAAPRTPAEVRQAYLTRPDQYDNKLLSVQTQCQWLRELGFIDVDIYFKSLELAVFAGRKDE